MTESVVYVVSSACSGANCVGVGFLRQSGNIVVRDTKNPDRPPLVYTAAEWRDFLQGAIAGEFDLEKLEKAQER